MQKLRPVLSGYFIVALCFFSMVSELKAEHRVFSEGIIARADSVAAASPIAGGIQLAKAKSRGDVPGESGNWRRGEEVVISWGNEPARVKIIGNAVLVPVTLMYGGNEAEVLLLLDTGAAATVIHTEVADQLSMNLDQARKTKVQVVGGGILNARVVRIGSLTVGPHTKRNWTILVVPHQRTAASYDGLLGMDVLRGLKYEVDFKKQVMVWK